MSTINDKLILGPVESVPSSPVIVKEIISSSKFSTLTDESFPELAATKLEDPTIEFQAEGNILNNFEVEFQRDERVLRWLTVRLDKFALDYSEKRKNNFFQILTVHSTVCVCNVCVREHCLYLFYIKGN